MKEVFRSRTLVLSASIGVLFLGIQIARALPTCNGKVPKTTELCEDPFSPCWGINPTLCPDVPDCLDVTGDLPYDVSNGLRSDGDILFESKARLNRVTGRP